MGDRTSYQITIGGKMSAETLSDLVEACYAEGLGLDWETSTADEIRAAFELAAKEGRAVVLNDHEVNYANAEFVESTCRDNALPYVKEWDAGGGFGPGIEVFDGAKVEEYASPGIGHGALLDESAFANLATREDVAAWFARAAFDPPAIVIEEESAPAA